MKAVSFSFHRRVLFILLLLPHPLVALLSQPPCRGARPPARARRRRRGGTGGRCRVRRHGGAGLLHPQSRLPRPPLPLRLGDQPWKARLAAIACIALATKVENMRVTAPRPPACSRPRQTPDLLLVLSVLGWRMHLVTPFSTSPISSPSSPDTAMCLQN